jgi:hypothetical protein
MNMNITKEDMKNILKNIMNEESEYQTFFRKALEKTGKSIPEMSDDEKKEFFNKINASWESRGEKNELNNNDELNDYTTLAEGLWPKSKLSDAFQFLLAGELKKNFKGIFYVIGYDLYHNDNKVMRIDTDKDSVQSIIKSLKSKIKESVNEGIGTIALGIAGGLLLLKFLKLGVKTVIGSVGMNVKLPKEKLLEILEETYKRLYSQSNNKAYIMLILLPVKDFLKDEINAGRITTLKQVVDVIEKAAKKQPKQESVNEGVNWKEFYTIESKNRIVRLKSTGKKLDFKTQRAAYDKLQSRGVKIEIDGEMDANFYNDIDYVSALKESVNEGVNWKEFYTMAKDTSGYNPSFEKKYGKLLDVPHIKDAITNTKDFNSFMRHVKKFESVNESKLKPGTKLRYEKNNFVIDYVVDKEYTRRDGFTNYILKVVKSNYPKKVKVGSTEEYEDSKLTGLIRNRVMNFIKNESITKSLKENFIPKVGTIDDFMLKDLLLKNPKVKEILSNKELEFLKKSNTDVIKHQSKRFNTIVTDGKLEFEIDLKVGKLVKPIGKARREIVNYYSTNEEITENSTNKGHWERVGNQTLVDSNFINLSKGVLPSSELVHLGGGDFALKTPNGEIVFSRTSKPVGIADDFVGRVHRMTDNRGGKLLNNLVQLMGKSKKAVLSMSEEAGIVEANCGCGSVKTSNTYPLSEFTISESKYDSMLDKLANIVDGVSFMNIGRELKKNGIKYSFSTSMIPMYKIDKLPIAIVNKKYAAGAEREVGDIAIGLLENKTIKESTYVIGKDEYTKRNLTPTQILDLAMTYANKSATISNMYGKNMTKMVSVANDLAKLTGTKQMDAKARGNTPALLLTLLKNELVTKDEYVKLYKNLLETQISVIKALKKADPAAKLSGGTAARAAARDMKGEFDESVYHSNANKVGGKTNFVKRGNTIIEGRAFINAARKAKEEGKTEFEFNGKTYPVTIK